MEDLFSKLGIACDIQDLTETKKQEKCKYCDIYFLFCDTEILVFHFNVIEFTFLYSMRNILNLKKDFLFNEHRYSIDKIILYKYETIPISTPMHKQD